MGKIEPTKTESSQNPPMVPTQYYGYYSPEDEIRLVDIWNVLVKQKLIVIGLTLIITIASVLYALFSPSIYRAEIVLAPPTESDVQPLIIDGINSARVIKGIKDVSDVNAVNVKTVYAKFKHKLSARAVRRIVFNEMDLLHKLNPDGKSNISKGAAFNLFVDSLSVSAVKIKLGDIAIPTVTLSMEGRNPVLITEVVKRLVKEAKQATTIELVTNVKSKVTDKIKIIEQNIYLLREKAKRQRLDDIKRLESADTLKKAINLDELSVLRKLEKQKGLNKIESLRQRELQKQLLILGHNRKVEQLKNRKSDDPFILSLRDKESKLSSLKTIQLDPKTISVARLEIAASPPEQRIKPRRKLIVVLGIFLGLMVGIFVAFIKNFIESVGSNEKKLQEA